MSGTRKPLLIAVSLSLGPAVAEAFALWAPGLLAGPMSGDLRLGYLHWGWLGAALAVGQAAGALLAWGLLQWLPAGVLFRVGIAVCAAAFAATGAVDGAAALLVIRAVTGLAAAMTLVSGARLALSIYIYEAEATRTACRVYVGGAGAGLVVCALLIGLALRGRSSGAWPEAWLMLGLVALMALPFAWWGSRQVAVTGAWLRPRGSGASGDLWGLATHVCSAAAIAIVAVFAFLWQRELGTDLRALMLLAAMVGAARLVAPVFWPSLVAGLGASARLMALLALAAGLSAIMVSSEPVVLIVAGAVIGLAGAAPILLVARDAGTSIPASVAAYVSLRTLVAEAAGQALACYAAGWLAQQAGTAKAALLAAVVLAGAGAALALVAPRSVESARGPAGAP